MADKVKPTEKSQQGKQNKKKKKYRLLKIILLAVFIFLVVLFSAAVWLINSPDFAKNVILPIVSDFAEMHIEADYIKITLFESKVEAKNITVRTRKDPFIKVKKFTASYSFWDILNNKYTFNNVHLDEAKIVATELPNRRWNFDPPAHKGEFIKVGTEVKQSKISTHTPTLREKIEHKLEKIILNLNNIKITNSTFILNTGCIKTWATMVLSDLNVELPHFENNKPADMTFSSKVTMTSCGGIAIKDGRWNMKVNMALDEHLIPYKIDLHSIVNQLDGKVNEVSVNDSNLILDIKGEGDKKSLVINKFSLRQNQGKWIKTNIELNSVIDFFPFKTKGHLKVAPLSHELITIVLQFTQHINPGKMSINWISDFDCSGEYISSSGKFRVTRRGLGIIGGKHYKSLPRLRMASQYDINYDSKSQAVRIKTFNADLNENRKRVLKISTTSPFTYLIAQNRVMEKQIPKILLKITNFDLSSAKLFIPFTSPFMINDGLLNANVALTMTNKQKVILGAKLKTKELDMRINDSRFNQVDVEQEFVASYDKRDFLAIPRARLKILYDNKQLAEISGVADVDKQTGKADFSIRMKDFHSGDVKQLPIPQDLANKLDKKFKKIIPFKITGAASGTYNFKNKKGTIKPVTLNVFQRDVKVMRLTLRPENGLIENFDNKSLAALSFYELPIRQFNNMFESQCLYSGYVNGAVFVDITNNWKTINFNPVFTVNKFEIMHKGQHWKDLLISYKSFSTLKNYQEYKLKKLNFALIKNKKKLFHIGGSGEVLSSKGTGSLNLALKELNYKSLNIFMPKRFNSGNISGDLALKISQNFNKYNIKSRVNVKKLTGLLIKEPVNGKATVDVDIMPKVVNCRSFMVDFRKPNGPVAIMSGSTTIPEDSTKPIVIKLESKAIDVKKIRRVLGIEGPKAVAAAPKKKSYKNVTSTKKRVRKQAKSGPLEFDFGEQPCVMLIDLKNIRYNSVLSAEVAGVLKAKGKHLKLEKLQISSNKDKLNVKGDMQSTPKGIRYQTAIDSKKFNLSPIFHSFLKHELKNMRGTLNNLDIKVQGLGIQEPQLWDNMTGRARSDFSKVKIPNCFSQTVIGKIVLLPFDILLEVLKLVPGRVLKTLGPVSKFAQEFQDSLRMITLDYGKADLEAKDGLFYIRDFHLSGPFVKELSFTGKLGLGSSQILRLKSSLNMSGIVMPVEILGTVNEPDVSYRKTLLKFMSENAFNIIGTTLDATGKIIKKGTGGVKDLIDSIF